MTLNILSSCLQLSSLYSAKDGTQSFVHAVHALCQMSFMPSPTRWEKNGHKHFLSMHLYTVQSNNIYS